MLLFLELGVSASQALSTKVSSGCFGWHQAAPPYRLPRQLQVLPNWVPCGESIWPSGQYLSFSGLFSLPPQARAADTPAILPPAFPVRETRPHQPSTLPDRNFSHNTSLTARCFASWLFTCPVACEGKQLPLLQASRSAVTPLQNYLRSSFDGHPSKY